MRMPDRATEVDEQPQPVVQGEPIGVAVVGDRNAADRSSVWGSRISTWALPLRTIPTCCWTICGNSVQDIGKIRPHGA